MYSVKTGGPGHSPVLEQVKRLPDSPGVYIMRDAGGGILYIGKALDLRKRVSSYFRAGQKLEPKTERLVARIANIDFFVATSEQEALILELNLIKQYRPPYNIRLKDDKSFPYLKISVNEDWPRVCITRRLEQDGGRYFGPFASAVSVKQTFKVLRSIFRFRTCNRDITGAPQRTCLKHHLGLCLGPCSGDVNRREYAKVIREVILFLEGKQDRVARDLTARMNRAAESLEFEKAALMRDQLQAIHQVIEGQRIAATVRGEQDAVAFAQEGDQAYVQVFFIRNNRLVGRESFLLQGTRQEAPPQIMAGFLKHYYASSPSVPPRLLLQYPPEDKELIGDWLQGRRGKSVAIQVPRRGSKKQLMDVVVENARRGLEHLKIKELAAPRSAEAALAEIAQELGLDGPPARIEAYDISNIQGREAVGSMVVFENGRPKPSRYRRFKIKTVAGANDYAMLQEVLQRRFRHRGDTDNDKPDNWAIMPDLILIDGGKGQLNAALAVLEESGIAIPATGLAKENEELFLPDKKEPLVLPKSSPGLQLLQRLRDEAHRFAVSYFTRVHKRGTFTSVLDGIPGIGPRRKRALLRRFGSVQGIRDASVDELAAATGMSPTQAARIKEHL